jgi:hypothetical protein
MLGRAKGRGDFSVGCSRPAAGDAAEGAFGISGTAREGMGALPGIREGGAAGGETTGATALWL